MTEHDPNPWAVGWGAFAGVMLVMVGVFQFFAGLSAIIHDTYYVVGSQYAYKLDVTGWGWIHLVLGLIVVLAGIGVFTGNVAARAIGVIAAMVSAIANFLWLPYSPVWSVVMIAVAISVIWALTAHGRDIAVNLVE